MKNLKKLKQINFKFQIFPCEHELTKFRDLKKKSKAHIYLKFINICKIKKIKCVWSNRIKNICCAIRGDGCSSANLN